MVEFLVAEYHAEHAQCSTQMRRERTSVERRLADAGAKIERLVAVIAYGTGAFDEVRDAPVKARAEREAASADLREQDALPVVALHPAIVADYRRRVADLQAALFDPQASAQAA